MTTTLFKDVGYSLSKLIEDIAIGEIGFPDIRHPFAWKNAKVRDHFDSVRSHQQCCNAAESSLAFRFSSLGC